MSQFIEEYLASLKTALEKLDETGDTDWYDTVMKELIEIRLLADLMLTDD